MFKRILYGVAVLLLVLCAIGGWWLFLDGRPPAARDDLIRMPAEFGPPPEGYPTENALMAAFATGTLDLLERQDPEPVLDGVIVDRDLEYGRVDGISLKLDLYRPETISKPLPLILFIHGGGWTGGDKADYAYYATRFPLKGYVVASMGYRFAGVAGFPGCVSDTKCAIRWLRANADQYHIDPDKIAVAGGSAGGYLAMMAGYSSDVPEFEGDGGNPDMSSAVQAVINLYGPTDLTTPVARAHPTITNFLKVPYTEAPERYERASPLYHVDASDPPTFIIQGTLDTLVTPDQADALAEKYQALEMDYWYDCYPGWPHTMDLARPVNERVQKTVDAFLRHVFQRKNSGA